MYKPKSRPLDPGTPAAHAATVALGDVLAEVRAAVARRRRLAVHPQQVHTEDIEAA
jgi:hypothetical protein